MQVIEWILNNMGSIMVIFCLLCAAGMAVYKFIMQGKEQQLKKVKEWLLFAVTQAEKELGSNTGQLKLRMVYGQFIDKFKIISLMITFEEFSDLVDESLDSMKSMLESNQAVKKLVEGDKADGEI